MRYTIYAIVDKNYNDIVYVGSTFMHLLDRQICHETKKLDKKPIHIYIERYGGWSQFKFISIYEGRCITDQPDKEKRMKEKEYIERHDPVCNINRSYRTPEELKADRKRNYDLFKQRNPNYTRDYCRENAITCECGQEYRKPGKWTHENRAPRHLYYLETGVKVNSIEELKKIKKSEEQSKHIIYMNNELPGKKK